MRVTDLIKWIGPTIWTVEYDKEGLVKSDTKVVVRKARLVEKLNWNERTIKLFACDCADYAMSLINPDDIDPRSIEAIRVARLYIDGKVTEEEMDRAAQAAGAAAIKWQTERLLYYLNGGE